MGCFSYKLYRLFLTPHSFSVTIFTLGFRLFFILLQIKEDWKHGCRGGGAYQRDDVEMERDLDIHNVVNEEELITSII